MFWLAQIGRVCILGSLGYCFPRFLIAIGVPLDEWIEAFGRFVSAPELNNVQSVIWGFAVIFTLLMLWVEGRHNLFERMFYTARPIKVKGEQVQNFLNVLNDADELVSEFSVLRNSDHNISEWQARAVQWDLSVQNLIRQTLPPQELISYATVNVQPSRETGCRGHDTFNNWSQE
jgi:hypothetical protein